MHSCASQCIEVRDRTHVFASTISREKKFSSRSLVETGVGAWTTHTTQHSGAIKRYNTYLHSFFLPRMSCVMLRQWRHLSYDVAIMELFRGMTKRKNADQMNHLLQDVGRAKTMMASLTFETAFKFSRMIRLSVSIKTLYYPTDAQTYNSYIQFFFFFHWHYSPL